MARNEYTAPLSRFFFCPRLIYSDRSTGKGDSIERERERKKFFPPYVEQRTAIHPRIAFTF